MKHREAAILLGAVDALLEAAFEAGKAIMSDEEGAGADEQHELSSARGEVKGMIHLLTREGAA